MHPLKLAARFVLHTVVGALLFSMVGGVAVLLNYAVNLIQGSGVSPYMILAVQALEFFLFAVDFICLVVFVIKEAWILVREIVHPPS